MWGCYGFGDVLTKTSQAMERDRKMAESRTHNTLVEDAIKQASKHLRIQKRVDQYFTSILNGLFSDGDLSLARIDNTLLLDKAEELVKEALQRADKVTEEVMKTDPIQT